MKEENSVTAATLNDKTLRALSQVLQDIRTTVSHSCVPGVSPLAVVDDTAVDALKDLFYTVNSEDPLNAMPVRRLIGEQHIVKSALLPLVAAIDSDPTARVKRKRWSVCVYQTLRILSVLSIPITKDNDLLKPGCGLDLQLHKFRANIAYNRRALHAFVSLLQYYIERKAEKQAALAASEESQLEDARIDNILCFFRNILSPPRAHVGDDIKLRDKGVHLALVGALVDSDFYSTISILFSSKEDAAAQYTDLVFLVADIYAQTYRHSSPREMYSFYKKKRSKEEVIDLVDAPSKELITAAKPKSVFDETPQETTPESTALDEEALEKIAPRLEIAQKLKKPSNARSKASRIRDALQRERAFVGGSRAVTKSARWSSRFSGGLIAQRAVSQNAENRPPANAQSSDPTSGSSKISNIASKRIVSVRKAIKCKPSLNPMQSFQDSVQINSDILCRFAVKGRTQTMKSQQRKSSLADIMRKDLQEEGLKALSTLTLELIDECFDHLVSELRQRIEETKTRSFGDEADALMRSQRAFLCILGSVVGFQREKHGKVLKDASDGTRSSLSEIHENSMRSVLASDFKIVRTEWKAIEAGIELDTFRLVFRILIESCESVRNDSKDDKKVQDVELSTFAVLQMMKMLQGMASKRNESKEEPEIPDTENRERKLAKDNNLLTPREVALNTIEQLFEEPAFLNAPADLAKDFSSKIFSFRHLSNIVEVTHAFTTILLDEQELAHLQVTKKKRASKAASKRKDQNSDGAIEKQAQPSTAKAPHVPDMGKSDQEPLTPAQVAVDGVKGLGNAVATVQDTGDKSTDPPSEPRPTRDAENGPINAGTESEPIKAAAETENNTGVDQIAPTNTSLSDETKAEHTNATDQVAVEDVDGEKDEPLNESEPDEPVLQEVESVGIIRRFANAKALQTLLLPLRAALCHASLLVGTIHNVPKGFGPILAPLVVAKSAHVVAAIWRVAKVKERGAMCGQFFTFSTMHLLGIVLEAMNTGIVLQSSVLERFSVFARDATRSFFSWLALSPGLTLDMFFPMDKCSCQQYMTSARQRDAVLDDRIKAFDSGSDSDVSTLPINPHSNLDFEDAERRISERSTRKNKGHTQFRRKVVERRRERVMIGEDEDVDDLDNLNLGNGFESSESDPEKDESALQHTDSLKNKAERESQTETEVPFCRSRTAKRKRASREGFDPFASDDEIFESKIRRKSRKKSKKVEKPRKEKKQAKQPEKVFYSSDDYKEAEPHRSGSDRDLSQPEEQGRDEANRRRDQQTREEQSEESDDSGAALESTIRAAFEEEDSGIAPPELHPSSAVSEDDFGANSSAEKTVAVNVRNKLDKPAKAPRQTPQSPAKEQPSISKRPPRRRLVLSDAESD